MHRNLFFENKAPDGRQLRLIYYSIRIKKKKTFFREEFKIKVK